MTPADRALAAAIRDARPRAGWLRITISGLDGSGKSTLCAALAGALHMRTARFRNEFAVRQGIEYGLPPGIAQGYALQHVHPSPDVIYDRGPLCVAAIHPEMEGWGWLHADFYGLFTIFLDLPLDLARARKADPEAEARDRDAEARRYRELAARWPRTVILDASQPPEAVLSAALRAVARAVGVGL